jgi:hypothetical protein
VDAEVTGGRKFVGYVYIADWVKWWYSWFRHCATSRKVTGSILNDVIACFSFTYYGTGIDSAYNRNEYKEYFLGAKE